jgi:uncharacterized repeat protein (TIGR01451 family)
MGRCVRRLSVTAGGVRVIMCRVSALIALAVLGVLVTASVAGAETFTVNDLTDAALSNPVGTSCSSTNGGSCTLRAAVQAADNAGGASTITLPEGDYELTILPSAADDPSNGDLDVKGSATAITINGAGAASTVIDANHVDRAFAVQAGQSLSLSGVTVRNGAQPDAAPSNLSTGHGYGGAFYNDGSLSVDSSVMTGNSADFGGGVVYADTAASSTSITNSTITQNSSNNAGAGLEVVSGSITLTNDTITHNSAESDGGAIYDVETGHTVGAVTISASVISDNVAYGDGGALFLNDAGALSLSGSTVNDDSAQNSAGGAIYDVSSGPITINDSTVSGDSSGDSSGGALYAQTTGLLTMTGSTFDGDNAGDAAGGAVYMDSSDLSVSGSSFSGDEGWGGGAIYVDGSSTTAAQTVTTSTFSDNLGTSDQAGAIYDASGDLSVSRSTFTGNNASESGGAFEYDSGDGLSLTNDTFDGNQAPEGGAIYFDTTASSGTVALLNDTIVRNSGYDGGGIWNPADANTIENTIVADNSGGVTSGGGGDCYESSTTDNAGAADKGGNIDSDGTCFSNGVSGDRTDVNPDLGPLAANGGPTQTDALLPGSPAIGAGISGACPTIDQRGVPRPVPCASGAFQAADADVAITVSAPATGTVGSPTVYTMTVTDNGPGPATGVVVNDALPANTTYFSSSSSRGSCSGTTTVTCALGTIDSSNTGTTTSATITLVLVPSKAGRLTNTATVTAATADPISTNNSGSASTAVSGGPTVTVHTAPVVLTGVASQVTKSGAKLSAIINPAGEPTTYRIQLGTSKHYGKTVHGGRLPGRSSPTGVVIKVKGLKAGKTYHFRIVASNASGTGNGQDATFKTKTGPKKKI